MAKFIDTWVTGEVLESLKLIRLTIKTDAGIPWGTGMGLGYTPKIRPRLAGTDTLFSEAIVGQWTDAGVESQAVFIIPTSYIPPIGAKSHTYEFLGTLSKGGNNTWFGADGSALPWSFTVTRWP